MVALNNNIDSLKIKNKNEYRKSVFFLKIIPIPVNKLSAVTIEYESISSHVDGAENICLNKTRRPIFLTKCIEFKVKPEKYAE
ncbi:hypothetical protein DRN89_03235 [archaeon]|nr:MAG: hypothetical protein DRN89_03235 [archaeon]